MESLEDVTLRRAKMKLLQAHYADFITFLRDTMRMLGYDPTWMQEDIADFLQHGPQLLMVQAQRGEAKTTITAIYAVWCLIQDPTHRVVVISAGGDLATDIAILIKRIIMTMTVLECMRPDTTAGDRESTKAFELHYSLKGIEKSPSVSCAGIGANLPGKRADLLIADDVESPKNSKNAPSRESLLQLTKEFTSICADGRVLYLGTPQLSESVYNTLPGRGFTVRVWPGRYPTAKELDNYGDLLAPSLRKRLEDDPSLMIGGGILGDQGQPTDPGMFDDDKLIMKQTDKGITDFQLQYMLNTKLLDSLRYPLKLDQCIVLSATVNDQFPMAITRGIGPESIKHYTVAGKDIAVRMPHALSQDRAPLLGIHMQIDPAGGGANADETGYAVTGYLNGNVYVLATGGIPGGYELEQLQELAKIIVKYRPNVLGIEKNMGFGAFAKVFQPILLATCKEMGGHKLELVEEFVTGQKEARIIGTLEPIIGRGSLIFLESCFTEDDSTTERYVGNARGRDVYSLFQQLSKITKDRKSLAHDDRADALEGSVRHWLKAIAVDQHKAADEMRKAEYQKWLKDPLQHHRYSATGPRGAGSPNMLGNFRR